MAAEKQDAKLREELRTERAALADAIDDLRHAADITGKLRARLPLAAAGALGLGFFKAGGIGATARLLMRRSREH
jgi:hypothetical protein